MKIAIEELLAAMDLVAAKALGQLQYSLNFAGLNGVANYALNSKPLIISGNRLEIKPEILRSTKAAITVKITVHQKNTGGDTSALLASELLFVRMPLAAADPKNDLGQNYIFIPFSAN